MPYKAPDMHKVAAADLYKAGHTVKSVADILMYSIPSIYLWLRNQKVVLRSTPNWSKYRKTVRERNQATFLAAKLSGEL